jgi:hypothetical protein
MFDEMLDRITNLDGFLRTLYITVNENWHLDCQFIWVGFKQACCMLYVFFWVIPRRLNFISRRFGTLYLFHLHRQEGE